MFYYHEGHTIEILNGGAEVTQGIDIPVYISGDFHEGNLDVAIERFEHILETVEINLAMQESLLHTIQ